MTYEEEDETTREDDYLIGSKNDNDSSDHDELIVYSQRWIQLVLFCVVTTGNAFLWITFAPVADKIQEYYSIGPLGVNSLSIIYMLAYIPIVFPSGWILDAKNTTFFKIGRFPVKGGLRTGIIIGAVGTLISALLRPCAPKNWFWLLFIAQTIGAIVQPFILNAPPLIAANWFPDKERALATTIASVANPVGVAVGFVMPPLLVGDNDRVELLLLVQGIIVAIMCVVVIIFVREKPPTPPSFSQIDSEETSLLKSLFVLMKDRNFWIVFITFGIGLGVFNTLATLLQQLVNGPPYNYEDWQASVFGALVILFGIVGSGICGFLVEKYRVYKYVLLGTYFLSTIFLVLFTLLLAPDRFWIYTVLCSAIGLTMMPLLPISLELVVEITYPIGEGITAGLLMANGQLVGIPLIVLGGNLIKNGHTIEFLWVLVGLTAFSSWLMILFYGTLKRHLYESGKENPDLSNLN